MTAISPSGIIAIEIAIPYSTTSVLKLNLFTTNTMNASKNANPSRSYAIRLSFFYTVVDCVLDLLIAFEILPISVDIPVDTTIASLLPFTTVLRE